MNTLVEPVMGKAMLFSCKFSSSIASSIKVVYYFCK
jgi:hypothetical protein